MNHIEIQDLKIIKHEKVVASFTLNINDILFRNCTLIRTPKSKEYYLCLPSVTYTSQKTNKKAFFPLVKLPSSLHAKALAEAIEAYEELMEE